MSGVSELPPARGAAMERLLLREFSHRTNNELASAIGLISVAAGRCDSNDARTALVAVLDRLQSYAQVHHSLELPEHSTTIDLTAYILQLCRAISHSKLENNGIALSLSLYPIRMSSERSWLLGMIVFELISNAARHAFDEGGQGDPSRSVARRSLHRVPHMGQRHFRPKSLSWHGARDR